MHYIFIINGRKDREYVLPQLKKDLEGREVEYEFFVTRGVGDATRFVNIYCDLYPKKEVCFVACGGAGTTNEVASGLVNQTNKYLAIYNCGGTNDFIKNYPERDFHSLDDLFAGEMKKVDIIKVNDNYALNVAEFGLDSLVAYNASMNIEAGISRPYEKAVLRCIFLHRFNRIKVFADGERMNRCMLMLGTVANGKYCGGQFLTAPRAKVDDGWMEVLVMKPMILAFVAIIMPRYTVGKHLEDSFCRKFIKYKRAKHVELKSKDLMYMCLDGEIFASSSYKMDILDKAITIILPKAK